MKMITINMGDFFKEKVMRPIRKRRDVILLLLETVRQMESCSALEETNGNQIIICIDKMSRVFYVTNEKSFSFTFPFSIEKEMDRFRVYDSNTNMEIDETVVSILISIFGQEEFLERSIETEIDFILEIIQDYDYRNMDGIWKLLFRLWGIEDGYIRYECDEPHQNGDKHPLYHLDVNYSSGVTYKLGLRKILEIEKFRNLLDVKTDCSYIAI